MEWFLNDATFYLTSGNLTQYPDGGDSGLDVPLNQWSHVSYVRASGVLTPYLNGVAGTPQSSTEDLGSTHQVKIGVESGSWWHGSIPV